MKNPFKSTLLKITIIAIVLLLSEYPAHSQIYPGSVKSEKRATAPDISITLSVFSGRQNPQWRIAPSDPDYEQLLSLIRSLKTDKEPLFNYKKWNNLGYATFWIDLDRVERAPSAVHVWRDMAYILQGREGDVSYAFGAGKLYEMLVSQAEKRDYKRFFVNYRRSKGVSKSGRPPDH